MKASNMAWFENLDYEEKEWILDIYNLAVSISAREGTDVTTELMKMYVNYKNELKNKKVK